MVELDLLGEALQLDVRPFPFQFPVHGELIEDRQRLVMAAHDSLAARGLIDGARFDADLEGTLGVFARGRLGIAMLGSMTAGVRSRTFCARATSDGRLGVVAEQRGETVRFTRVHPDSLPRAILGLLPALRAGPGHSMTMTTEPPRRAGRARHDEDDAGGGYLEPVRPVRDSAAGQRADIDEIMRRPRLGGGYFTVTSRGRNARESEPLTMSWLDTDRGRYAVVPTKAVDGRLHVTYTPADHARLDQTLTRLVRDMA